MPRPRKWPPTYLRHASGQAYFRWEGSNVYLGAHGSPESYERYRRKTLEIEQLGAPAKATAALTVGDVVASFLDYAQKHYSEQGREYKQFCSSTKPLLALYQSLPVSEFGPRALKLLQVEMGKLGWCRNVINRRIVRVRTLWRWAEERELVPAGSWNSLRSVRGVSMSDSGVKHTRKAEPAKWADVLATAKRLRAVTRHMLLLQWWSGMRSKEIRTMRVEEIDTSAVPWIYVPGSHKNSWRDRQQSRIVVLGPKCKALLGRFIAIREKGVVFPSNAHMQSPRGYTDFSYAQAVRRAARAAGVSLYPYQCRHAAKERITRALGLDAARAMLGHRSIGTTGGYAAQIDLALASKVACRMG